MKIEPYLRIEITCSDLTDILCRTLDQVRRMGLTLVQVAAVSAQEMIDISICDVSVTSANTLIDRIKQMSCVVNVSVHRGCSEQDPLSPQCLPPLSPAKNVLQ